MYCRDGDDEGEDEDKDEVEQGSRFYHPLSWEHTLWRGWSRLG